MPDMVSVSSSNIAAVGYDEEARELYVEFRSGKTYVYSDVGQESYNDMLTATSPGSYLARFIKGTHGHREA